MKPKVALLIALTFSLAAFSARALAQDVVLTSIGQSPDATMVKVVLKKMNVAVQEEKLLTAEKLGSPKVLIAVVGGSSKGLGAAGVDKNDEIKRAEKLLGAARQKKVKVLVMHVGGSNRRGALSDSFIIAAVPFADQIIVVKGGNDDKVLEKHLRDKSIAILEAASIRGAQAPLEKALAAWGVK
jgi:hypothetical protein